MIKTDSLKIGYKNKIVIDNVNIEVEKGNIVTLIGANGSGKSTLLKTIATQIEALDGKVILEDKNILEYNEKHIAKKMAIVFSEKINFELMTCKDVIETGRYPYTGSLGILSNEDKSIVERIMDQVNVKEIADAYFNQISDGQKQRVMLGRALCQQPDILILDEPTSYLDIKYKLEILKLIKDVGKKDNIAVIMSLHDLDLARIISDKVICIKNHKIDKIGKPEDIFNEEYIRELFDIKVGGYNPSSGEVWI